MDLRKQGNSETPKKGDFFEAPEKSVRKCSVWARWSSGSWLKERAASAPHLYGNFVTRGACAI